MRLGGIVLCGGRSSRMGRPKAWLPFGGELMLPRVVRLLGEAASPVVVVAAPGQDVPPLPPDVPIARDDVEGRGPLQGLAAGLAALDGLADAAYLSACDVPFLSPTFVRRLAERLGDAAACVPDVGGRRHPLAAVYRLSVRPAVLGLLAAGRLRATDLFDAVPTRFVGATELTDADPDLHSLKNINTPDDYAAALGDLAPRG